MKPILKWAGGKTKLLPYILKKMPKKYERYIEPFAGGAALFFHLEPDFAILSDSNHELINCYFSLARMLNCVVSNLKRYVNTEESYYVARSSKPVLDEQKAARTFFLNKTCFNGLYRVNKAGEFNVPYGKYVNREIYNIQHLEAASKLLQENFIFCADYKLILQEYATPKDLIFLDPPYMSDSKNKSFTHYTSTPFDEGNQRELAKEVERLDDMGCYFILTNSNHPLIHELYGKFSREIVPVKRSISCKGKSRRGEDMIITNIKP